MSMCSLSLVFAKKFLVNLFYSVLYFLYLRLLSWDHFVKWFMLLDFSFFSFCDYLCMFPADLVTFAEEILNWKHHFLCSVCSKPYKWIIFRLTVLQNKSMDWFLYDNSLRYERINIPISNWLWSRFLLLDYQAH